MKLERFFEKFDLLAEAPGGVAKLRELVLELAVRGRLVQQRTDEGHARAIFTGGKSRGGLQAEREGRFDAPSTWCWVRFGLVGDQRLGKMLDQKGNRGELKPYLRNTNVQWMRFELDDVKELRLEPDELAEYRLEPGDLLICEGGQPGRCAIWRDADREMYFQKALHRVRPRPGILPEYLAMCLRADARNGALDAVFTGATIKHLTGRALAEYTVPIPPPGEQKRIVARVDALMALCHRLEAQHEERETRRATLAQAALNRFAEAPTPANLNFLFHDSYTIDPADLRSCMVTLALQGRLTTGIPAPMISIGDLVGQANLRNGLSLSPTAGEAAFSCLPLSAMRGGEVDCERGKPVALTAERAAPYLVRKGDIFVIRGNGSKDLVARAGVVRSKPSDVIFPDLFIRVPVPEARMLPDFFLLAWNSPATRLRIESLARTTSGIWKVNQGHIAAMELPLPPLAEQAAIVERVSRLTAHVREMERLQGAQITRAQALLHLVMALMP